MYSSRAESGDWRAASLTIAASLSQASTSCKRTVPTRLDGRSPAGSNEFEPTVCTRLITAPSGLAWVYRKSSIVNGVLLRQGRLGSTRPLIGSARSPLNRPIDCTSGRAWFVFRPDVVRRLPGVTRQRHPVDHTPGWPFRCRLLRLLFSHFRLNQRRIYAIHSRRVHRQRRSMATVITGCASGWNTSG